jgi:uncharacterized repeat protein (TIGR04076 family)
MAVEIRKAPGVRAKIRRISFGEDKEKCMYGDMDPDMMVRETKEEDIFCPRAYDSVFPYINSLLREEGKTPTGIVLSCPSYPDFVIFEISCQNDE